MVYRKTEKQPHSNQKKQAIEAESDAEEAEEEEEQIEMKAPQAPSRQSRPATSKQSMDKKGTHASNLNSLFSTLKQKYTELETQNQQEIDVRIFPSILSTYLYCLQQQLDKTSELEKSQIKLHLELEIMRQEKEELKTEMNKVRGMVHPILFTECVS